MGDTMNHDWGIFDKVLMKIKDLLEKGDLITILEFKPKLDPKDLLMEFYNDTVEITIHKSINESNDEIWEIKIISTADRDCRYRDRANVNGNSTACEIYRLYKEIDEKSNINIDEFFERTIDDYVDSLFN